MTPHNASTDSSRWFDFHGRPVHPIGVGGHGVWGGDEDRPNEPFATPYRGESSPEQVDALRYSLEQGQNWLDTAQMYSCGGSEEAFRLVIQDNDRTQLVIGTKIHRQWLKQPELIIDSIRESLRRLGLLYVDVIYIHALYPGIDLEACLLELCKAKDMGLVRHIGVCNFTPGQVAIAQRILRGYGHRLAVVQNLFNPFHHHAGSNKATFTPESREYCRQQGIFMVAHTPFHLGVGLQHPEIQQLSLETGHTPAQLILAWIIQHEILPIPSALVPEFIRENVQAAYIQLEPWVLDRMNAIEPMPLDQRGLELFELVRR